jgi:hypothetical protein
MFTIRLISCFLCLVVLNFDTQKKFLSCHLKIKQVLTNCIGMKRFYTFFLFLCSLTALKAQQNGIVKGTISDKLTKELLPGATIAYKSGSGALSDINGEFNISLTEGIKYARS